MTALNALVLGAPCTVTTHDRWVVTGTFLGIEVAHGDRSILLASRNAGYSIPVTSVASTSGPDRRAA
jgi:hypothetical protein